MNPLILAVLGVAAGAAGVSMLLRKSNAVAAKLDEYWRRVGAGEDPDDILREWFEEASPLLTIEEVEMSIPDGFALTKAEYIVNGEGRFVRGLDPNRRTADGRITPHWGIDISGEPGSYVMAATTGVVSLIEPVCGYGNIVGLSHLDEPNRSTFYAHLQWAEVGLGQVVRGGTPVGRLGATTHCPDGSSPRGWAPGQADRMAPHLHMELHPRRVPAFGARVQRLDPVRYLAQEGIALAQFS